MDECHIRVVPKPWDKGKLVGQKTPLELKEIWPIRVRPRQSSPHEAKSQQSASLNIATNPKRGLQNRGFFTKSVDRRIRASHLRKEGSFTDGSAKGQIVLWCTLATADPKVRSWPI